jgi:hypothetical protein
MFSVLIEQGRKSMESQPDGLKIGLQLLFVAIVWISQRYFYRGRPLTFFDFFGAVGLGTFSGSGLFWLTQRPSLEQITADINVWPGIAVAAFVLMCVLVTYGLYYRITKGRPIEG